jgi:sugar phosphate isomerase/epimerase
VEILADVPHLYAGAEQSEDLEKIRTILTRTGLKPANLNANTAVGYYGRAFWEPLFEPSIANPDPAARQWRVGYTQRCIDMAHALGAPSISITSGRMASTLSPDESMGLLLISLREIVAHAEHRNIRVGIEYEPGLLIENYREMDWLLKEIDSPFLGVNLDLGHSHVLGEDPERVAGIFGERIVHVHLEDIGGRKHYHLIPGLGQIDFEAIFRILEKNGYDGFVTVELYTYPHAPEDAARNALLFLNKILTEPDPVRSLID